MKIIFLVFLTALQSCCSTPDTKSHLSNMRSSYARAVSFENSDFCFIEDEHAHLRHLTNKNESLDFWTAFADYRLKVGPKKAFLAITDIVNEYGGSTILFLPVNDDLRGSEVDQLVNSLLIADVKPTKWLVHKAGRPCDLALVNKIRSGLLR